MNIEEIVSNDKQDTCSSRKTLSCLIREARISVNLSQRAFANELGITQAQLCRLENGTAQKPNRRTLKALLPYLKDQTYEDLLAMAGYSIDFIDIDDMDIEKSLYSLTNDELANGFKNIKPELFEAARGLYEYLDDPKNTILLQKIFNMIKSIGSIENLTDNEALKQMYLRDCILNLLQ